MARPTQTSSRGLDRGTLLAAAAALFARKGYRATTLDDIAGELGLKKASLYHYIRSKDELLAEIYQLIFDRIEQAVAPLAGSGLPVDERLRRMVHAHIAVVTAELPSLSVAFSEEAELPAELQRRIRHRKRGHEAYFEAVIEEGQRQGVFRPGSARLMVLGLLGMCNWIYKWYRPDAPDGPTVDEIATEFARMFEAGIGGGRPGGGQPRFTDLAEAFAPVEDSIQDVRAEVERLAVRLGQTRERLRDGLAGEDARSS